MGARCVVRHCTAARPRIFPPSSGAGNAPHTTSISGSTIADLDPWPPCSARCTAIAMKLILSLTLILSFVTPPVFGLFGIGEGTCGSRENVGCRSQRYGAAPVVDRAPDAESTAPGAERDVAAISTDGMTQRTASFRSSEGARDGPALPRLVTETTDCGGTRAWCGGRRRRATTVIAAKMALAETSEGGKVV
jgi:hypothetical protein